MKKLYLSLLCATILSSGSNIALAKDKVITPAAPQAAEQQIKLTHENLENKLADDLKLTDEQREKANAMRMATREKMKPIMNEMKNLRIKMDKIREENMKAFENILTPEQKQTFKKIKDGRKTFMEQMRKQHERHPMPPMPME